MTQTLTEMPGSFAAGTTLEYTRSDGNYPASQGWTMKLYLAGKVSLNIAATASGDNFIVLLPSSGGGASTDDLSPGLYKWVERFTKSGKDYDVNEGYVTVEPNMSAATGNSLQLHLEKVLELIEARIEGRMASGADMDSYQVDSVAVSKIPWDELMDARNRVKEQLRSIAAGGQFSRPVLITFTGVGLER